MSTAALVITEDKIIQSYCSKAHNILGYQKLKGVNIWELFLPSQSGFKGHQTQLIDLQLLGECKDNLISAIIRDSENLQFQFWILSNSSSSLKRELKRKRFHPNQSLTALEISPFGLISDCLFKDQTFFGFDSLKMIHQPLMNFIHIDDIPALISALKCKTSKISCRFLQHAVVDCSSVLPIDEAAIGSSLLTMSSNEVSQVNIAKSIELKVPEGFEENDGPSRPRRRKSFSLSSMTVLAERRFPSAHKETYDWIELEVLTIDNRILTTLKKIETSQYFSFQSIIGLPRQLYKSLFHTKQSEAAMLIISKFQLRKYAKLWQSQVSSAKVCLLT